MRNRISDDMVNIMLRQMGAKSIKTSPAHINIAKFDLGEDLKITYMYEVKEEEIYLQRVSPYPMMIGKIYNETKKRPRYIISKVILDKESSLHD